MKSYSEYLHFRTKRRIEIISIQEEVEEIVRRSGIREGLVLVNSMHTTASVFINDDESGLHNDIVRLLKKYIPPEGNYQHNLTGEDNGYAHIWREFLGRGVVIALTEGRLDLGTWERIFYAEFDGQREKRVLVKIIGE